MDVTRKDLLRMSGAARDELFAKSPAGPMPDGETRGTALFGRWTWLRLFLAWLARVFKWQGKVFDAANGRLINRISVLGFRGIRAKVYAGPSWVDQKECVVIDYSQTSFVARMVRDEIRLVSPGLYLGKVWWGKQPLGHFAIEPGQRRRGWILWERVAIVLLLAVGGWAYCRFVR